MTKDRVISILNTPFLAITALLALFWLGWVSQAQGYTAKERNAMDALVKRELSHVSFQIKQQPIKAYTKEQAWQYADLWDSPEYAQPVVLRRGK